LTLPTDGPVVDDPMSLLLKDHMKAGSHHHIYVLESDTVTLVPNEVKLIGPAKTTVHGKTVSATLVEISDRQITTRVYVDAKGALVRADGPLGIEIYPVSRTVALGKSPGYDPKVDLAYSSALKTDKPIEDPGHVAELKLRFSGPDLRRIPNDEYQTVAKDGNAWTVDIHPPQYADDSGQKISEARVQHAEWTKPTLNMPSSSDRFVALARRIVGDKSDVHSAAFAIRKYVYETMRPNAGIAVLRDANEILNTKEGVCRDYAVLTGTLLRAAGIPARLASGIVSWDGTFYYHAWAEAWDGRHWIGVDSTSDDNQISAAHVKLGEGNVEEAFAFTFLDQAKIEVLSARRR